MKTFFPLSPVILHLGLLRTCLATCYYPSGKEAPNDYPCDPNAETSVCCGGAAFGIACLSNRVCLGPSGKVLRGSCTDPTWRSPDCPQFCQQSDSVGDLVSCQNVTKSDEDYCCVAGAAADCCQQGLGRFTLAPSNPQTWAVWDAASTRYDVVMPLSSTTPATTSSSSSTSSATTSPSTSRSSPASTANSTQQTPTSATPAPTESGASGNNRQTPAVGSAGLSTAAQAGIGVGAAAGAALLAAVAYLAWKLNKAKRVARASQWTEPQTASYMYSHDAAQPLAAPHQPSGFQSQLKSAELPGWERHELQS